MSKELIVSSGRHETKVAILEDDLVVELFHEREKEYSLAGSIHKGRVTRVLPGMQSAFVDIGLERDAFLYVSDFFEDNDEYEAVVSTVEDKVLRMEKGDKGDKGDKGAALAGELPTPLAAAPSIEAGNASAGEAEAIAGPVAPSAERGERTERNDRGERTGDRGGDRGGRGRRGRRRRGGRGSGLPESKFFSPRAGGNEAAEPVAPEPESEPSPEVTVAEPVREVERAYVARPSEVADFMVLPGESLAKYSPSDGPHATAVAAAPVAEPIPVVAEQVTPLAAPAHETKFEDALPDEHPLAGLGAVSSWVAQEIVSEEIVAEAEAALPISVEPVAAAQAEAPVSVEVTEAAEIDVQAVEIDMDATQPGVAEDLSDDEGLSASEVAEIEAAADLAIAEEMTGESSGDLAVDEGPEPARIPTSLTAQLREQGHRYPHRVSRRMRRKMRTGPPGSTPVDEEEAAGEVKTVAPREERRPDSGAEARGQDRQRERSDRPERNDRGERPARGERPERGERSDRGERTERVEKPERERPPLPSIADLLKEGQEIIVQIAKEPLGQKGARITSHIALPGRFVVYMPTVEHVGVSRKIPSDEERQRLKRVLQTHRAGVPGGFICRTAAENKSEEELRSDMHFLYNLWLDMRQKAEKSPAPKLLHHDLDLVQRILRDQLTTSFKTIWVDNEELYESILRFVERFQPALIGRVKLYTRTNPIFDEFGVTAEIEKALRPKVWLKSGGHIVINQTEALVAIDINTGKYVGKSNRLEDTIVKINTDAIKEIVRQIRLRDLGGIIVVDFIDMDERKNRQKVMVALEDAMRVDRAPYKILQFNDFGLVAITRKRVKQSLERTLCAPCPYCEGAGHIKNVQTIVGEILQEAQRMHKALEAEQGNLVLRVNPEVAKVLKSNHNSFLQEIEEILKKPVLVKSDPLLHQAKFDLA